MWFQWFTLAFAEYLAVAVFTRFDVVDAVAVADIEAVGGAKLPNGMLNKARKYSREVRVESSGIDLRRNRVDDVGTAAFGITTDAVAVLATAIVENTAAVQKVMDERVDGDHVLADREPSRMAG